MKYFKIFFVWHIQTLNIFNIYMYVYVCTAAPLSHTPRSMVFCFCSNCPDEPTVEHLDRGNSMETFGLEDVASKYLYTKTWIIIITCISISHTHIINYNTYSRREFRHFLFGVPSAGIDKLLYLSSSYPELWIRRYII